MKSKKICFLLLFFFPALLFAAGEAGADYDIIERTINFVIFFGLVYYFAADAIKNMFKTRRDEIANSLVKIQERLQDSKKAKEKAHEQVEEAKQIAKDILENARKESLIITQKFEDATKMEIENLVRQCNESMLFEKKKAEKMIVDEVLSGFLNKDSVVLNKDVLSRILLKRVA